ncbi:MAG: MarR family transcriptional regulator [Bacteroidota bacterium]
MHSEHENKKEKAERLIEAMGRLIIMMQEVNDTCLRLSEDISKKDLMIVSFVGDNDSVIMREIADYMKIPVSTTTGIVDKLVQKGYLSRQFSPTDRRSISIVLDEIGKNTHLLMSDMKHEMAGNILNDLEEFEASNFIEMLEKVTNNLHKYVPFG